MASFVSGGNTISKSYIEKELSKQITDSSPYNFRRTADGEVIGDNLVSYDTIVGGSIVWNQLAPLDASEYIGTTSNVSFTMTDGVFTFKSLTDSSVYKNRRYECLTPGHKYFVTAKIYNPSAKTGSIGFRINDGMVNNTAVISIPSEMTGYETFSAIGVPGENQTCIAIASQASLPKDAYFNVKDFMVIDLTSALTTTIADYNYSLEQTTAGAGVAWVKKYFPEVYYNFAEPHFEHVQVSAKNTVGFNRWDEVWELGDINSDGSNHNSPGRLRSKNHIPAFPETVYYMHVDSPIYPQTWYGLFFYDDNKQFISTIAPNVNRTFTTPAGTRYIRFYLNDGWGGKAYTSGICINLHGDRDGEYEAYKKRTYPFDSSLTLRGIPKLDSANNFYFNGDTYESDGTVTRRINQLRLNDRITDLKAYPDHETELAYITYFFPSDAKPKYLSTAAEPWGFATNLICTYSISASSGSLTTSTTNSGRNIYIHYPEGITSLADFKTWLNTHIVDLIYYVATPTTETAEPFQSPMVVDSLGTEEFVDYAVEQGDRDVAIPVGHETTYEYGVYGKIGEVYDSPTFYGTPTAPTAESGTNTNQIATTAFVQDAVGDFMQKGVDYVTAGQLSGTTLGIKATAEGDGTTASGNYSHAEGSGSIANGNASHAEGYQTVANGMYSHAEGYQTEANAHYAHAEGYITKASGLNSHAEGEGTIASSQNAHAEGFSTTAQGKSQHVFGEYNILDTTGTTYTRGEYVEIVGNGTSGTARANARTLDWSGNEVLAGKLTVGAAPTNNMDAATKKYVDDSILAAPAQVSKLYTATCPTAAATTAKVATLDDSTGFSLTAGVRVAVTFTYGNTATTPTLNVSSSGAKTIAIPSSATAFTTGSGTTYNTWGAYETVVFTYTGTYWTHDTSGRLGYLAYSGLESKANTASPTFTGTPTAPTATAGTNTTQIATTGFVQTALENKLTYGNTDLTAGTSTLAEGVFYAYYE